MTHSAQDHTWWSLLAYSTAQHALNGHAYTLNAHGRRPAAVQQIETYVPVCVNMLMAWTRAPQFTVNLWYEPWYVVRFMDQ